MPDLATDSAPKVLLYGRSGPYRIEASYARALRTLGCRVKRFSFDPQEGDLRWWLRSRVGRRITRRSLRLRRSGARRRNRAFLDLAAGWEPELVLLVNGAFVMPETVAELRRMGAIVAVFHPDAPIPGSTNGRPEHLPAAREADLTFIWSRKLVGWLDERGVRKPSYLPFAWDPEVFPHVDDPKTSHPEVVFVGGWDAERERWLEPVAKRFELKVWGPDYWRTRTRRGSPLRQCWQGGLLCGWEAAETVAGAKIVLNVLRSQNLPDGTNMRTFEVPGAGGFLLATRTTGAVEVYPEGEAGAYFGSRKELLAKIEHYLDRPGERRGVSERAHEITAEGHRYVHRARRILACAARWE